MYNADFKIEQLELFTEMTVQVGILPLFNDQEIYLLSGEVSELKANHETAVPLWLALLLKKQQKCKILPLYWLNEKALSEKYILENKEVALINLQEEQFFELSYIMLNKAPSDIDGNPTKVRNLVDSLREIREEKIKKLLKEKKGFEISNATTYELNKFKKVKSMAMNELEKLSNPNKGTK